jgi:hypothetical protein
MPCTTVRVSPSIPARARLLSATPCGQGGRGRGWTKTEFRHQAMSCRENEIWNQV